MNRIKVGVIATMLPISTVAMAPKSNTENKDIVDKVVAAGSSRRWPRHWRQPIWWIH
jgi:hypothetical protein